ncbi:Mu-like prophage major head subunit gpT family protein [Sneathiella sp.]|uniref:Mu-like prophage major head subunit gpT family protein n=1 Tax=Sneathiella sp. TaxID=1964365 RepID=UPI002FE10354
MIINGQNLRTLNVGFNASFQRGFDAPEVYWQHIATQVNSTTASNEYGWLGNIPGFREWFGDRVIHQISAHGYAIKNRKFELTVGVAADDIKDDNIGIYSPLMEEMGRQAKIHPDQMVFEALLGGFDTACFDGQYFFDTDHPVGLGSSKDSVSNFVTGSGSPWFLMDTSRALKPLIYQKREDYNFVAKDNPDDENVFHKDQLLYGSSGRGAVGYGFWQLAVGVKDTLDAEGFREARNMMRAFKNDAGVPLGINPKTLIVGAGNADAARDVLLRDRIDGSSNPDFKLAEIVEVPWLD